MNSLSTNLLREKFIIYPAAESKTSKAAVTALSNRMVVELTNRNGKLIERFVVRAHNMHSTVRMCARIQTEFTKRGPILTRENLDWKDFWDSVTSDYERDYNAALWIAIYANGKPLFKEGTSHPFFDVIERCDEDNPGDYERSVALAEEMFRKAGKNVKIDYDGNVALVVNMETTEARFGIILRGADRTTTFSFSVKARTKELPLNFAQCLMAATAFLEGIQLAFLVGMNNVKLAFGLIEKSSPDHKKTKDGRARLGKLTMEISNLEMSYEVRYRPEKPNFDRIVAEAEGIAQKVLKPAEGSDYV